MNDHPALRMILAELDTLCLRDEHGEHSLGYHDCIMNLRHIFERSVTIRGEWTKTPPTEPGFYWTRYRDRDPRIMEKSKWCRDPQLWGETYESELVLAGWEFWPVPLTPP